MQQNTIQLVKKTNQTVLYVSVYDQCIVSIFFKKDTKQCFYHVTILEGSLFSTDTYEYIFVKTRSISAVSP